MSVCYKTNKPCFICGKAGKNIQMKNAENTAVLCPEHFVERLEEKPKKGEKK